MLLSPDPLLRTGYRLASPTMTRLQAALPEGKRYWKSPPPNDCGSDTDIPNCPERSDQESHQSTGYLNKINCVRLVILLNDAGISPENWLQKNHAAFRLGRLVIAGIDPVNWLLDRITFLRFIMPLKSGTGPVNWFPRKSRDTNKSIWFNASGIVPLSLACLISRFL